MYIRYAIYHVNCLYPKYSDTVTADQSLFLPEVIKLFSCSTQFSMKFVLLINVKMPTSVGILNIY